MYMYSSSWAKMLASEPPAPGWISSRQGKAEKGCGGMRDVLSVLAKVGREEWVDSRSVVASSRNSESADGSSRRDWSSETDCMVSTRPRRIARDVDVHGVPPHTPSAPW